MSIEMDNKELSTAILDTRRELVQIDRRVSLIEQTVVAQKERMREQDGRMKSLGNMLETTRDEIASGFKIIHDSLTAHVIDEAKRQNRILVAIILTLISAVATLLIAFLSAPAP